MANIPELESHCGSWVIVSRETGRPLCELFDRANVERIATCDQFEILTAAQWLGRYNASHHHAR